MMMMRIIILILLSVVIKIKGLNYDEDTIDSVINLLLSGDSIEEAVDTDNVEETSDEQPIFEGEMWKCGECDVIDETKLIYGEVNDVDTNILDDTPFAVQVGLTMDNMQCVTISARADNLVRRELGSCSGSDVTLSVHSARHFVVNVYGY